MSETVIKIEDVKKQYRLGAIGGGTLQGDLQSWWARVRGKEDPNSKIGSKTYGKNARFYALDGINLEIKKGERLGIIGHNGAGKSTLLKLLSRVTAPTEGTISVKGRISSMLEVGTGFHGELTGRENIYLNGAILGMSRAEVSSKIDKIIEFSECEKFIDTPVKRYSSGMYVKLAFSVAAHLDSEILVMDEVLAVGDIAFQQKCLNKMQEVAETEGRTILYVSHNMNTVQQLCNRCVVMDHGKIVFDGDVNTAISIYADMSKYMTCYKDYSEEPRKYTQRENGLYLLSAEYLDKKTASFFRDEKLKLRLKFENVIDNRSAGLRLEIRTATGTPLCTYLVDDFYKGGKKGTVTTADLTFDISALVPGAYRTTYTLYDKNEYGSCANIECVRGLGLEILEGNNENNIKWDSQNWGWIEMPEKPYVEFIEEN